MKRTQLAFLLGLSLIILVSGCTSNSGTGDIIAEDSQNSVKIPVTEITNTAKFFTFETAGTTIKYFAVRGTDGKIRTAFDACDVCGGYKGYRQQGNDMICNNCGRYFNIDDIGTKNTGGGCWPSYLNHEIEGEYIVIDKNELVTSKWRFS